MASDSHHLSSLGGVGRGHSGLMKGDPELRERSQLGAAMATCKSGASDSHPSCSQMEGAERAIVHARTHTGTLSGTHAHSQAHVHTHGHAGTLSRTHTLPGAAHVHAHGHTLPDTCTLTGKQAHSHGHMHTTCEMHTLTSFISRLSQETGVSLGAAGWTYWPPACPGKCRTLSHNAFSIFMI